MSEFSLTKRQVKAFLDVMSKDDARPALCRAQIDKFLGVPVMVATDSYQLCSLGLSDEMGKHIGQFVHRDKFIKWHKLASSKDLLTEDQLIEMMSEKDDRYPKWQSLIPDEKNLEPMAEIAFNAAYLHNMQDINNNGGMTWEFYGKLSPIVSRVGTNTYVVMPIKN